MPDEPLFIQADNTLLTQALKNLVENALKFTKMGGSVSIKALEKDDQIVFSVQDSGPGIAPIDQQRLTEKFQHRQNVTGGESAGGGFGPGDCSFDC